MSRRSSPANSSISLFPFLAVLVCTMGALILLLITMTQKIRLQSLARTLPEVQVETPEEPEPAQSEESPEEPQALIVDYSVREAEFELERQRRRIAWEQSLADAREERERARRQVQAAAERVADGERRLQTLRSQQGALVQKLQEEEARKLKLVSAEQSLRDKESQLGEHIALTKRNLDNLRRQQATAPNKFAIVPYDGASGTMRRPIYIECTQRGLRILPEDEFLGEAELDGFTEGYNPLLAATESLARYWNERRLAGADEPEPYVLLLVRPKGTEAYYAARKLLTRLDCPFGYELIDEDWQLNLPKADPQAKAIAHAAIAVTLKSRQEIVAATGRAKYPRGTDRRIPDDFSPKGGAGEDETDDDGDPVFGGGGGGRGNSRTGSGSDGGVRNETGGRGGSVRGAAHANAAGQRGGAPGIGNNFESSGAGQGNAGGNGRSGGRPAGLGSNGNGSATGSGGAGDGLPDSGRGTGTRFGTDSAGPAGKGGPEAGASGIGSQGVGSRGSGGAGTGSSNGQRRYAPIGLGNSDSGPDEGPYGSRNPEAGDFHGEPGRGSGKAGRGSNGEREFDDPELEELLAGAEQTGRAIETGDHDGAAGKGKFGANSGGISSGNSKAGAAAAAEHGTGSASGAVGNGAGSGSGKPKRLASDPNARPALQAMPKTEDRNWRGPHVPGAEPGGSLDESDRNSLPSESLTRPGSGGGARRGSGRNGGGDANSKAGSGSAGEGDGGGEQSSSSRPTSFKGGGAGGRSGDSQGAAGGSQGAHGGSNGSGGVSVGFGSQGDGDGRPGNGKVAKRWGYSNGRATIGLERKIEIHSLPNRLLIGPHDSTIEVAEGESKDQLLNEVLRAIEGQAESWGRPPGNFYWIPTIRFVVYPGGNQHYERVNGPLRDWGVFSTVDYSVGEPPKKSLSGALK